MSVILAKPARGGATSGGVGYTISVPTGDVDGSNTTFSVTNEPVFVVADGTTYVDGGGYSYAALSIEMDNPPSQYIKYFF